MGKFIEEKKSIWDYAEDPKAKIFININGTIQRGNKLVMGRGNAKEAKDRLPNIALVIGRAIAENGLRVMYFEEIKLGVFPTKAQWYLREDAKLVETSAEQLRHMADQNKWEKIVLGRSKNEDGGLEWKVIEEIFDKYFDERFIVENNSNF